MANRVLRDWTASERVDLLSAHAERFFTRLIMKADDYGAFYADPRLLRAAVFPLKDNIRNDDVMDWLIECERAGLIQCYRADGKEYLMIINFGQRLRAMRSKFPLPADGSPSNVSNSRTNVSGSPSYDSTQPPETETETETEVETESEVETETESEIEIDEAADADCEVVVWPSFDDFWQLYDKKIDRPRCEKKWKRLAPRAREHIMAHLEHYIRATPDKQFRKNPLTYLNNQAWENEVITPQQNGTGKQFTGKTTKQQQIDSTAEYLTNYYREKFGSERFPGD